MGVLLTAMVVGAVQLTVVVGAVLPRELYLGSALAPFYCHIPTPLRSSSLQEYSFSSETESAASWPLKKCFAYYQKANFQPMPARSGRAVAVAQAVRGCVKIFYDGIKHVYSTRLFVQFNFFSSELLSLSYKINLRAQS